MSDAVEQVLAGPALRAYRAFKQKETAFKEARDEAAADRDELERLRAKAEQAREEAESRVLIGGDTATVTKAERRVAELEQEIETLEGRKQEAQEEKEQAWDEFQEALRDQFPAKYEGLIRAIRAYRAALDHLGQKSMEGYLTEVLEAQEELERRQAEMKRMLGLLDDSSASRPMRELRTAVKAELRGATGREALGYLVLRAIELSRCGDGALADLWATTNAGPRAQSILHAPFVTGNDLHLLGKKDEPVLPISIDL